MEYAAEWIATETQAAQLNQDMFIPWWLIATIGIVLAVAIGSAAEKYNTTVSKLKKEIKELKDKLEEPQEDNDQE